MGFSYCLYQPNVAHCNEDVAYRILERPHTRLRLNRVGFNCEPIGNLRFMLRSPSTKSLKRVSASRNASANSSRLLFNHCLWNSSTCGDCICLKTYRGKILSQCQGNDSLAYIDGNGRDVQSIENGSDGSSRTETNAIAEISSLNDESVEINEETEEPSLEDLRELLQKALTDLEVAQLNSTMFEEKAQRISEAAIALKDEAASAWNDVNKALNGIQETQNEEAVAKEAIQKATMAVSLAEARLQVAMDSLEVAKRNESLETSGESKEEVPASSKEEEEALLAALEDVEKCRDHLANCEADLRQLENRKEEQQKEIDRLNEVAEQAQMNALKAEEDVANIMLLAEQAVAFELEATQHVNDVEIAIQKAEKNLTISFIDPTEATNGFSRGQALADEIVLEDEVNQRNPANGEKHGEVSVEDGQVTAEPLADTLLDIGGHRSDESHLSDASDQDDSFIPDSSKDGELDSEKSTNIQSKKQEVPKELARDSSPLNAPKALLKKSSRFFSASFFSSSADGDEFTRASVFHGVMESARKHLPKLVVSSLLLGAGFAFYFNRSERISTLFQQPDISTTSIHEINEEEASLLDMLWLLLASVIFVPVFQKLPGGSPVLGYLTAGILIGPYGLSIIRNVHGTKAIAEFGVVFLLFNIGLELSVERLSSMKKYVFGLGTAQVLVTAAVVGMVAHLVAAQPGPAAIVIGNGLALSSTAVVLQVGFRAIAEALGLAAVKAIVAIAAIIAGGRLLLRPIYKQVAENQNAEIFSANTLLVILGTSLLTARAGLSMALGAFLAGLLLAETEFSLQVESDIAPYRGLLLGLFFMTILLLSAFLPCDDTFPAAATSVTFVGMSIDPKLLLSNFPVIMGVLGLLIGGKTILVALVGKLFGISIISAIRVGLLLAPGGEFAFVAFGEAVNQGIMSSQMSSLLFLVVGISMAITPWLAAAGQLIASRFELQDVRSLLPVESETDDLQDHIIICGFGRVGQIIAQLLSERLIPFVALDVRSDRVAVGRALDLPVYFGDAGSREVLHKVGAHRACAAAITLDTPGANYRTVWALNKYFPNIKTFVRAHDVDHGLNLEKAGATAVVPETLEPSLQLAAAVLVEAKLPMSEITATINEFRSRHLAELTELCQTTGNSLGYGFSRVVNKPKAQQSDSSDEGEGALAI
nr:K(+) efflux antiporter 2, chloroplastic [Ipomoea batatas]